MNDAPRSPDSKPGLSRAAQHARVYLQRGWRPLPLEGKRPFWKDWPTRRLDEDDLHRAFSGGRNVGILHCAVTVGDEQLWLVDVDLDCPEAVAAAGYLLPPTPMRHGRPGSGIAHHWYLVRPKKPRRGQKAKVRTVRFDDPAPPDDQSKRVVEILGDGSQSMVPPSIHPSGEEVVWGKDVKFEPPQVGEQVLLKAVQQLAAVALLARRWREGVRSELAMHLAGWWAKSGISREHGELLLTAVCTAAHDNETNGRLTSLRHTYDQHERGEKVAGWQWLKDTIGEAVLRQAARWLGLSDTVAPPGTRGTGDGGDKGRIGVNPYRYELALLLRLNDEGNAARFANLNAGRVLHCQLLSGWYIWDGTRWRQDETKRALALARETALKMRGEALGITEDVAVTVPRGDAEPEQRMVPAADARGLAMHWSQVSLSRQQPMLDLASSTSEFAVLPDDLDADPLLFNVANGTLDLRPEVLLAGGCPLLPHESSRRITKLSPVDYDPAAQCPRWDAFMGEIFEDEQLTAFMHRLAGYVLFGGNPAPVVAFLWGTGANGKSTWLNTLTRLLGDYSSTTTSDTITAREGGSNNQVYALARLKGTRLVTVSETDEGQVLAEGLVKTMTGGEAIAARFSHGNFFEYIPEFTPVVSTNHMPSLRNVDEALRRRVLLVPFKVTIAPDDRDLRLMEKLETELPGILNRALAGLLDYYEREFEGRSPLAPPEVVQTATERYFTEQDPLAEFIDDRCQLAGGLQCVKSVIYNAYREWCEDTGRRPWATNKFGGALKRHLSHHYGRPPEQLEMRKTGGKRWWIGIALAEAPPGSGGPLYE